MAKVNKASKKVDSSIHEANISLVEAFKDSLLPALAKEYEITLKMMRLMFRGVLSVRGAKATMKRVNAEAGALPTIVESQAQYFLSAFDIHETIEGAKDVTLSALINVTIQGTRKAGKEAFADIVADSANFSELSKVVEALPAKVKNQSVAVKGEALVTADAIVSFFVGSIAELEDITPTDSTEWDKFLNTVERMSKARANAVAGAKSRHASARVKANA
jgi:hypothetical protein